MTAMAKSPPDVIFCAAVAHMRAVQEAMPAVPIVGLATDMVATGLVKSLARPDGNITGISLLSRAFGHAAAPLIRIMNSRRRISPPSRIEAGSLIGGLGPC